MSNQSIVYGLTLEPSGIDPHRNQSSELGIILRQVYDTLVYRHPETNEIVPGLAHFWEISEDGLIYTFFLKEGVRFHDGTPFNAEAIGINLDRVTNPELLSQKAIFLLGPYIGYEVVDDLTIRIRLSQPFTPLLDSLSQVYLGIASPTTLAEYSVNRYQFHQVGTGPFTFEKYTPGNEIVLHRNDNYTWGPDFYQPPGDSAVNEIIYRFFTDPPTRSIALEVGDAQVMGELLPADARALAGNSQIRLIPAAIPGQPLQFLFNTQRYPTDDVLFRQALLFGTNRDVIVDTVFRGFSPVAWGPISAATQFYDPQMVGRYTYDLQQTSALLTSIGFADGDNNGYLDAADGDVEAVIIVPPWGSTPEVAQLIQDQWRDLGVKVVLDQVPGFTALRERIATGEYNLVAFNTFGYDPVFLNQFYLSAGSNNYTGFADSNLDGALLAAVQEPSAGMRRGIYSQIQQFIMDQALVLPIRDYVNLNGTSAVLDGLQFDSYGWFPLMHNTIWAG